MNSLAEKMIEIITLLVLGMLIPGQADRRHADVENIGRRTLSGLAGGLLPESISLEKEIALGKQTAAQLEVTMRLIEEPLNAGYIDRLGQYLVRHSDARVPFRIKLLNSQEVDVFAIPGGHLYVTSGLVLAAENEAELAGAMAHGISHLAARHAAQVLAKARVLQVTALPAYLIPGHWPGLTERNATGPGSEVELTTMNRAAEHEADQLGIQYLWNSGYDTGSYIALLERFLDRPAPRPGFLRVLPDTRDRIAASTSELRYLPAKDRSVIDTSEFERVQQRLRALGAARK
jgi:beta-barrel assembly-enhancing protease